MATQEDVAPMKVVPAAEGAAAAGDAVSKEAIHHGRHVERQIAAPREVAFGALCDLISEATGGHAVDGRSRPPRAWGPGWSSAWATWTLSRR